MLMTTLIERMEELMRATQWDVANVAKVAGVTESAVYQWLGKGSKAIHSIGKIEAASKLEKATGFCALWIAKGKGPKRLPLGGQSAAQSELPQPPSTLELLQALVAKLEIADEITRLQAAPLFERMARDRAMADAIASKLASLLDGPTLTVETKDFTKKQTRPIS